MNSTGHIPTISVGISTCPEIHFDLIHDFSCAAVSGLLNGAYVVRPSGKRICLEHDGVVLGSADEFTILPECADSSFVVKNVAIGIQFHWQRHEDQRFRGLLRFVRSNDGITAINTVNIEEYLSSVISSEMSAAASLQFLKAHAIASRSWLLAQLEKSKALGSSGRTYPAVRESESERIRWYDREEHDLFDVCADDHCQRYQGITKAHSPSVRQAVDETGGEVLVYGEDICDARFSKCCGGVTEEFHNVWEPLPHPYLRSIADDSSANRLRDLCNEGAAREWIHSSPPAFCNTSERGILSHILPAYDQETTDFFRWTVEYAQDELADIIRRRSGIDFGAILDLLPMERGSSARLTKLMIVGTRKTLTIGKELEIRRSLSPSHLHSSAFLIDKGGGKSGIPSRFVLRGAGWGHGVGLCQIGAAVMGERGYTYTEILSHYFPDSKLQKLY